MPTARSHLSTVVVDGSIYAFGGTSGPPSWPALDVVERYDPNTDTWTSVHPIPTARLEADAALLANRICFTLLGRKPSRFLDFIGVNYYARQVVKWRPSIGAALIFGVECTADHHGPQRTFSELGWEVFAPGLTHVLRRFSRYGLPLMVTENGIATRDEQLRCTYLTDHLQAVSRAINDGVSVIGYHYWTLMDNFEWAQGRTAHFGLAETDFRTQKRHIRPAAEIYRQFIAAAGER